MQIALTIDGQPEGKRRPRTRVIMTKGRPIVTIYSDKADKERERLIRGIAWKEMAAQGAEPFAGPVRISIEAVFEVPKSWTKAERTAALTGEYHTNKPDADNVAKSILDGLNPDPKGKTEMDREAFCLGDDAQVAELLIRKRWGSPARTTVNIRSLGPSANSPKTGSETAPTFPLTDSERRAVRFTDAALFGRRGR